MLFIIVCIQMIIVTLYVIVIIIVIYLYKCITVLLFVLLILKKVYKKKFDKYIWNTFYPKIYMTIDFTNKNCYIRRFCKYQFIFILAYKKLEF